MRRREFITLLGGAAAWPLAARAQQPGEPIRRIGVLQDTAEDDPQRKKQFARFRDGLASFGWLEGRTVRIDYRFAAADSSRYQPLAKELVALQPDVILAVSTPVTAALQRETTTIPIIFLGVSGPIGSGFASSLARPGGNLTGLMMYDVGIAGKWLAMLKEIAPRLARAALVAGPRTTAYDYFVRNAEIAGSSLGHQTFRPSSADTDQVRDDCQPQDGQGARSYGGAKGVQLKIVNASTESEIDAAFATFLDLHVDALVIGDDPFFVARQKQLVSLASRYRISAIYQFREFAAIGGLVSYGPSLTTAIRQAGIYTGKILKGAKPIDLPVQQPTKFELVINVKTAKTLGIEVPQPLQVAADEVIE
jgi:putative ABC transport system substrate-binding protein